MSMTAKAIRDLAKETWGEIGKVYYQDTAKKGQFQGLSSLFLLENLQNTKQQ